MARAHWVLIGLVGLFAGLLGLANPTAAHATRAMPTAISYTYDSHDRSSMTLDPVVERGPPARLHRVTADDPAGFQPGGELVRPDTPTDPRTYDYDVVVRSLSPASRSRGGTEEQVGSDEPGSVDLRRSDVAANSVRKIDASWGGTTKYRHGGEMTAIEHINYRHAYNSGFSNVSRYSQGTSARQIRGYVDEALRTGKVTDRGVIADLGRTIGTDRAGNPVTGLEVIVRNGSIKTAYPVGAP